MILESGRYKSEPTALLSDQEKEKNYVLACLTKVQSDITARIPEETLEKKLKIAGMGQEATANLKGRVKEINPMLMEIPLELTPATLDDSVSDLDRLNRGLKKTGCDVDRLNVGIKVMRELAAVMRNDNWKVTASIIRKKCSNEVLNVRPGENRSESLGLAIDVGTNGEIVLGNKDWLMTASCSAGPAFEGGGVRWGMRAEEGAIEKVSIDPETLEPMFSTIGDASPRGICGSGMIDLISEMLLTGIIGPDGKFKIDPDHPRMKKDGEDLSYIVAFANDTAMEEDIVFSEIDINSLVLSKGAVYAGFSVLLNQAGLDFSTVDRVWITGGFGQYLNIEKAITIGLLPDIDRNKFKYLGNSSIAGAYMALLSDDSRKEAREISNNMTYIDFSSNNQFMDEFTSALFLPHTDLNSFPRVQRK